VILRLASRGIYLFDYADLINYFVHESYVSTETLKALLGLRVLKHGYRNRLTIFSPQQVLSDALAGAEELLGQSHCAPPKHSEAFSGYRGLRMLELDLVTKADPRDLDLLPLHDPLAAAWALIREPRGYPKPGLADEAWYK
jgi:hypothetical protein